MCLVEVDVQTRTRESQQEVRYVLFADKIYLVCKLKDSSFHIGKI